jgi:hypothetical protein
MTVALALFRSLALSHTLPPPVFKCVGMVICPCVHVVVMIHVWGKCVWVRMCVVVCVLVCVLVRVC